MVSAMNPVINKAYAQLQVLSDDERNRMLHESRLKAQRDENSRMRGAIAEGLQQGLQQGAEAGRLAERIRMAKGMLANGLDGDLISQITGLSLNEIDALRGEQQ